MEEKRSESSHGQILKSSALIGGSSAINVLIAMIRVKFTAVYLGPLGVGLVGAYNTVLGPLAILAGMGINTSGVRQLVEASGHGDQTQIARSLLTIRRAAWVTGLLGAILLIALSFPLAKFTFGNTDHALALSVLSLTILIGSISGALGAIIQALRRIRDLAAQAVLGPLISTPIAIALMIFLGVRAVIPMMLAVSLIGLFVTWFYARRIKVESVSMTWRETWTEAKPMLHLGVTLMCATLLGSAAAYIQRVMIIRQLGVEANGMYTSAWNLSNYYVGFILGAMGADFYPRLTKVNGNHAEVNRLVNEQTEVGLIMAMPRIIATLTLAPVVMMFFYTAKFTPAVAVLRWQTLGLILRLVSWPMGFIMLAKGAKGWYFWTELISNLISLGFMWIGIRLFGLVGAGVAFFALYVFYVFLALCVSKYLTGFAWSRHSLRLIGMTIISAIISVLVIRTLPLLYDAIVGGILAALTGCYSLRELSRLTGRNILSAAWQKLNSILGLEGRIQKLLYK